MGRKITNVGWCWTPRCEVCDVCTGRRTLLAIIFGVLDNDCPNCELWSAERLRMTQDPAAACGWLAEVGFCSGRMTFGVFEDLGGVQLEINVFEVATSGPQVGQEVFIGDLRWLEAGVRTIDCDDLLFRPLVPFIQSAYVDNNGWQQCNWAGSSIRIGLADCVNTET